MRGNTFEQSEALLRRPGGNVGGRARAVMKDEMRHPQPHCCGAGTDRGPTHWLCSARWAQRGLCSAERVAAALRLRLGGQLQLLLLHGDALERAAHLRRDK